MDWIQNEKKYARSEIISFFFILCTERKTRPLHPDLLFTHHPHRVEMKKKRKETQFSFFFSMLLSLRKCMRIPIFYLSRMHSEKREFVPFYFKIYCFIFHFSFFGVFDRLEIKGHTADSSVRRTWYPSHRRRQKPSIIYASRNETSHVVVFLRENGPSLKKKWQDQFIFKLFLEGNSNLKQVFSKFQMATFWLTAVYTVRLDFVRFDGHISTVKKKRGGIVMIQLTVDLLIRSITIQRKMSMADKRKTGGFFFSFFVWGGR